MFDVALRASLPKAMSKFSRVAAAITVIAHLIVNLLHGRAHTELAVGLTSWQQFYVIAIILLAPLIALLMSWTRYARAGLWLLLVSMLGSLIFGACYHYIIVSNDHVAHLPPGDARGLFRATALLLLLTEAAGVVLAAIALRQRIPERD
jgi:hypothetical protein